MMIEGDDSQELNADATNAIDEVLEDGVIIEDEEELIVFRTDDEGVDELDLAFIDEDVQW